MKFEELNGPAINQPEEKQKTGGVDPNRLDATSPNIDPNTGLRRSNLPAAFLGQVEQRRFQSDSSESVASLNNAMNGGLLYRLHQPDKDGKILPQDQAVATGRFAVADGRPQSVQQVINNQGLSHYDSNKPVIVDAVRLNDTKIDSVTTGNASVSFNDMRDAPGIELRVAPGGLSPAGERFVLYPDNSEPNPSSGSGSIIQHGVFGSLLLSSSGSASANESKTKMRI